MTFVTTTVTGHGENITSEIVLFGGVGMRSNNEGKGTLSDMWIWTSGDHGWQYLGCEEEDSTGAIRDMYSVNFVWPTHRKDAFTWTCMAALEEGSPPKQLHFMFGGFQNNGYLNDLWALDPHTHEWMLLGDGSQGATSNATSMFNRRGVYGEMGEFDASNWPGARCNGISWVDQTTEECDLYMFSGKGFGWIERNGLGDGRGGGPGQGAGMALEGN